MLRKNSRSKSLSHAELRRITSSSKHLRKNKRISFEDGMATLIRRCVNRGIADITIQYYRNELKVFRYYLADYNEKAIDNITELTPLDIERFVKYMRNERNSSIGNVNTKLKALKTFLRINALEDIAEHCSPLQDEKYKVKAFTTSEVSRLLDSCDLNTFIGIRDYTIMLVFADTGIRVQELSNLLVDDFDKESGSLHIRYTKNRYSRFAPISNEVKKMISVLISLNYSDEYLFQSLQGKSLSRVAIQRRVQLAGIRANISKNTRCSPHTFRHYYAKTMIENGANIFELQKLLGHQSLEMVRVYVNLFDKNVFNAHKKYTPTNNLMERK